MDLETLSTRECVKDSQEVTLKSSLFTLKALEKDHLSVLLNAPCHQKILFEKIIGKKLF